MVQFTVPQPPQRARAQATPARPSATMTVARQAVPTAAAAAPGEQLKVGRVAAPRPADAQAEMRQKDVQLRDSVIADGLRRTDEAKKRGQSYPAWHRIGGEEFERRAQIKDSFAMIWSRERGLHADLRAAKAKPKSSGTYVYTWGMGYHGQLGKKFARGEIRMSLTPNLVPLPAGVSACQVTCGAFHTMVLSVDGRVFSWGEGRYGQLGYACLSKQETPLEVTDIDANCGTYLAAGRHHSAMIDCNGSIWCWGHGKQGQLGDGERPSARPMPKKLTRYKTSSQGGCVEDMPTTLRFKQLACGARHTAAISTDGELFTFGSGKQGQLGHGMPLQDALLPTPVEFFSSTSTGNRARFVDASATLNVVVTEGESAYCWGMADYIHGAAKVSGSTMSEEFGNAHTPPCYSSADEREKCVSVPKPICPTELKVEQAQVGQGHIVVLSKAGDVYAWGQGSEGEIGSGVKTDVHAPRLVMTGKGVADITVGRYHNICITEYGLIYSWGAGEHGQLGHGLEQSETLPRLAEALLDTVAGQIACGEQHTAALTAGRGMQTLAGCEAWRSQEESELRIKQQMVVSLPLGLGARELLSIGPTVRTYVDLFDDDEVPLKANVVNERDKEVRPEVKKTIVEETQASLRRGAALENSLRAGGGGEGAGNQQPQPQQQAIVFGTAADGTQSEDEEDDRAHPVASVGKLHAAGAIDDVSDATNQMLQIKTMTAKLKSTAQMAEQARQRAAARQAEEERQATEIAKAKLEGWATRVFTKMDTNNDQRLTYNELKTGLDAEAKLHAMPAGLKFTDGKDIFVAIDTDHDGHVTEDEFIQEVIRVCDLKDVELFTANTLETGATGTSHLESDSKQGKGKCGMPAGMSMSSKGKARGKGTDALPNTPTLKPTPPPRIHDPKMRAADERVLIAFFAEFQPEFATKEQVQEIIHFYAKEQARKARISPMSNATAGGGDYRDPMRAEYRRQRGVDPWEWYESVRRGEAGSNSPKSAVDPTTRFARATGRATVGVRKQARARRAEYVQARNQQTQGRTPRPVSPESDDEATKKALKKITDRKPLSRGGPEWKSARRRAEGTIRPHTAVALSKDRKAAGRQVGPLGVGSAMTARTATPAAAIGGATGLALVLPDEPAPGTKGPGEPGQSPRIIQRAKSARLHRERREQMARSAHHAQSHISQLDRGIFKGVQDLRSKDSKAKDHWMALFSPLGPRFDFMRQAGELLVDSRRAMSQGRGATERSASRTISKISLLRSKLDQTKTALESKIKKLDSLKIEYANLVAAAALEDEALKAMHAEQARTSTLLETVHTRLMEASENHEELYSTQIYMKEHILSMQLIQQERSDELTAAKRLHSSLVALRERSEMMALGVMQEVKGLREDNATVRAQFQEALEQYTAVRKRSGDCVDQTQMIIQNRLQDRKAREERSLKKRQKAMRKSIGTTLNGELQKSQLTRARRYQQVFFELRELIGDIDVSNPADVDRIIEKCKSMGKVAGQGSSSHRLVNMSLLEDRQIATRRIEMLKNERDGLIELLRASFEITHEPGDENPDFYCVSPISYQLLYSEDPLLAAYENYTPVELLDKKGEAEWGFTDSTLVWSEYLGASHATHARRNGWLTWGGFKALRKQGVANIVNLEELRCGHPSRTLLPRNEAEHRLISRALELGAEEVQRRDRLQSEVHASLDVISMMKPLAIRARLWLGGDLQTSDEDRGQQLSQAQTSFYVLVFAIARELGLDPRENALPDLVGILQSALRKLELPSTMLGSFADIKAGKAPSMRDLVAHICHHPKIAIRTGWPEHAETERLDESLQAPRPVLLGNVEDDPHDGRPRVEQGNASATAPAVNSRADGEPESGLHAWTMGPEQVEPLSCLEDLEQALSCMMSALAAGERLQNALGKDQEHRLTRLMRQTEQDLARQAKRHPSSAITKATLRDYCLTGGEGIPDPSAHARVVAGALADASGQGPSSPSDVIDEAAHEVRKAELRAAYLAWDVVTVDLDTLLEDVQERKEARKRVQAPLYGSKAAGMRNTAPTGVGVVHPGHGTGIKLAPKRGVR